MSQILSRKRPAPGASPISKYSQAPASSSSMSTQMPSTRSARNPANQPPVSFPFSESIPKISANYPHTPQPTLAPQPPSNQVARRSSGQDVAQAQKSPQVNGNYDVWPSSTDGGMQELSEPAWGTNGDELDQKALVAKGDAQAKRKQIPPFIQKLSR